MGDGFLEEEGLNGALNPGKAWVRSGQHSILELTSSTLDSSSTYSYMTLGKLFKHVMRIQALYSSWHSRSLINNVSLSG